MAKRKRNFKLEEPSESEKKTKEEVDNTLFGRVFLECDKELPEFKVEDKFAGAMTLDGTFHHPHGVYAYRLKDISREDTDAIHKWVNEAKFSVLYTPKMRQMWSSLKADESFAQKLYDEWIDVLDNIWRHQKFGLQTLLWLWDHKFTRESKIRFMQEVLDTRYTSFGKLDAWSNSATGSFNISDSVHFQWYSMILGTNTADGFFELLFTAPFDFRSGVFGDMNKKLWANLDSTKWHRSESQGYVEANVQMLIFEYMSMFKDMLKAMLHTNGKMENYYDRIRILSNDEQVDTIKRLFTVSHAELKEQFGPPGGLSRTFAISKHYEWGINAFQRAIADGNKGVYDWFFVNRPVQLPLEFISKVRDEWFQRLVLHLDDFFDIVVIEWTKLLHNQIPILKRSLYSDTLPSLQDVEKELKKTIPDQEINIIKKSWAFLFSNRHLIAAAGQGNELWHSVRRMGIGQGDIAPNKFSFCMVIKDLPARLSDNEVKERLDDALGVGIAESVQQVVVCTDHVQQSKVAIVEVDSKFPRHHEHFATHWEGQTLAVYLSNRKILCPVSVWDAELWKKAAEWKVVESEYMRAGSKHEEVTIKSIEDWLLLGGSKMIGLEDAKALFVRDTGAIFHDVLSFVYSSADGQIVGIENAKDKDKDRLVVMGALEAKFCSRNSISWKREYTEDGITQQTCLYRPVQYVHQQYLQRIVTGAPSVFKADYSVPFFDCDKRMDWEYHRILPKSRGNNALKWEGDSCIHDKTVIKSGGVTRASHKIHKGHMELVLTQCIRSYIEYCNILWRTHKLEKMLTPPTRFPVTKQAFVTYSDIKHDTRYVHTPDEHQRTLLNMSKGWQENYCGNMASEDNWAFDCL